MQFKDVIQAITLAGVPGQLMNWMPAPQAPMGCPPGLEYLTAIDQVLVQQQIELLEGMLFMYSLPKQLTEVCSLCLVIYMLWFSFILGLILIFPCFKLFITHIIMPKNKGK